MGQHGVLLTVAYDGTDFSGWATQRDARTVEDAVRGAIVAVDPRANGPRGASRTDAGVHATGQVAAFDTSVWMPPRGWVLVLNSHLPDDVSIRAARPAPRGYNPRYTSAQKRYRYQVVRDKVRDPLLRSRAWRVGYTMDFALLAEEARDVLGTHDFAAFRSVKDAREHTVRHIERVEVQQHDADPRRFDIVVEGNAFLYNMVRIVVGTLVDVARGNLKPGAVRRALESLDRGDAGQTAPAHGLVLEHIVSRDLDESELAWPR